MIAAFVNTGLNYILIFGRFGFPKLGVTGAAMTLTYSIQGLLIGALSGLAQAAGIIIGKELGKKEYDSAYHKSQKLIWYGFMGSVLLAVFLIFMKGFYVDIFNVKAAAKETARQILIIFAMISPIKVLNKILAAFVLKLPIPYVYFMLSLEELVRLIIALAIFMRKKWMKSI